MKPHKSHTDEIKNGYSLNIEGKKLLSDTFVKYFDEETIRYKGKNQTRSNTILYDAHSFANTLIKSTDNNEQVSDNN